MLLTSDVVQERADGLALRYESRSYRLGLPPVVLREPSILLPPTPNATPHDASYASASSRLQQQPPATKAGGGVSAAPSTLKVCGVRNTVPYWSAASFLAGSLLFIEGSFAWMIPQLGDEAHGASHTAAELTVAWPYFVGSVFFTIGCYLAWVEVRRHRRDMGEI